MLDGDLGQRGKRPRLVKHAFGQIGMHAHALPLAVAERAWLVPDRIRDAEATEIVHESGPPQYSLLVFGQSQSHAALDGELATARECPSVNGDFRSTKFAIASSAASTPSSERGTERTGSAAITTSHARVESSPARIASASASKSAASAGSNCVPARRVASVTPRRGRLPCARPRRTPPVAPAVPRSGSTRPRDDLANRDRPTARTRRRQRPARPATARAVRPASPPAPRAAGSSPRLRGVPRERTRGQPGTDAAAGSQPRSARAKRRPRAGFEARGRTCRT